MKDKITKLEAEKLCKEQGFTFEILKQMFEIMPNSKTYTHPPAPASVKRVRPQCFHKCGFP